MVPGLVRQFLNTYSVSEQTLIFRSSSLRVSLGLIKSMFGGMAPFLRIIIPLINPATPLDASRWPIFDFIDPTKRSVSLAGLANTENIELISALSP